MRSAAQYRPATIPCSETALKRATRNCAVRSRAKPGPVANDSRSRRAAHRVSRSCHVESGESARRQIETTSGRRGLIGRKCANITRMNKLALVVLFSSAPAWAEWTIVSDNDAAAAYADIGTLRKYADTVEMSTMIDFKNTQRAPYGPEYLSQKTRQEYNCDGARARVLQFERYSGQMGSEDVVTHHVGPDEWIPVPPGSTTEALSKIACK